MKKIALISFLFISMISYSQNFKVKALMSGGFTVKYNATLKLTDSLFLMKGYENTTSFDITNKRNNITYLTDGTKTFYYTINKKNQRKKGQEVTHELYFTSDDPQTSTLIVYYLEKLEE